MDALRVLFLGTGAGSLTERMGSAILLRLGDDYLLLDAGYGANVQLVRAGIDLCRIRAVLVTHHHIDHCGGLPSIFHDLKAHGCLEPLALYMPPEAAGPIEALIRTFGPSRPHPYTTNTVEPGQSFRAGPFEVRLLEAIHPLQTLSAEVRAKGFRLLYSSDTAPYPEFEKHAREADLCIHEATLPDHMEELGRRFGHSTVSQALRSCRSARRTALVHLTTLSEAQLSATALGEGLIVPRDLDELVLRKPGSSF